MNNNKFLTLLMGKCWHEWKYEGQCKYCGAARWHGGASYLQECAWAKNENYLSNLYGFQAVKSFMEKEMSTEWSDYLNSVFDSPLSQKDTLNYILDLNNLVTYLSENREWGVKECKDIGTKGIRTCICGDRPDKEYCNGTGIIKHPALVYLEESCEK